MPVPLDIALPAQTRAALERVRSRGLDELRANIRRLPTSTLVVNIASPGEELLDLIYDDLAANDPPVTRQWIREAALLALSDELDARIPPRE